MMGQGIVRNYKIARTLLWLQFCSKSRSSNMTLQILNESSEETEVPDTVQDPVGLSKTLHQLILRLKGQFMSDEGCVDYPGIKNSPEFTDFHNQTKQLAKADLASISDHERKVFFLNIYNTLTVHALVVNVTDEKSVLELDKFWQKNVYQIGPNLFSLDDIEHGVLRCNKIHPTTKKCFFEEGDPRRDLIQQELDPRIHFALNCGAKSCPPIRLFTPDNLEKALDLASKNFCQNELTIDVPKKSVKISKILDWYGSDFGPDDKSKLERIRDFLTDEQSSSLNSILDQDFKISYSDYIWKID